MPSNRENWPSTPAAVGLEIKRTERFSRDAIAAFAAACGDTNPLHDARAIHYSFGQVIASGQQTSAAMLGLVTSYFSRPRDNGSAEVLVLHVNFAFKQPVFSDEELTLRWQVDEVSWNVRQAGHIVVLSGGASTERAASVLVARAALLVRAAP